MVIRVIRVISKVSIIFYLTILFACENSKKENQTFEVSALNSSQTDSISKPLAFYSVITPKTKIEVLTAVKKFDTSSIEYKETKNDVDSWSLSAKQIETILYHSKETKVLSCFEPFPVVYYSCNILINNKQAYCQVLKDAKVNVKYSDTTITLGYMNDDFSTYFLDKFWEEVQESITKPKPTAPYLKITSKTKIEVLTAEKIIDTIHGNIKAYSEMRESLRFWTLTKSQIKNILYKSKEINGGEWHHLYSHLPAHYSGEVLIGGKIATYKVQAGAVSNLFYSDTSIRLGYPHSDYSKYFFDGEWKEQYEDDTKAE